MLKASAGSALGFGVSPRLLMARVAALRLFGRLPHAHTANATTIERIFFSFPYHSVGDPTLSLTLLDRIRDRWPEARIDVAVGATMAPLIDAIPYVSRTFRLDRSTVRHPRLAAYAEIHNATRLFQAEIASHAYDLAIAPRWDSFDSFFSGYLAYLTQAPIRCGYSGRCDGGSGEVDRFYTIAATGGSGEHESLRYTRLLSRCGLERDHRIGEDTTRSPIRALQQIAASRGAGGAFLPSPVSAPYAVLSPGATKRWHLWPVARFAAVGRQLQETYGIQTIVIGSRQDAALCAELSARIGSSAQSMAAKTDIPQMFDLIARACLFVGNESGPAHIAGGLGIGTVVLSPHAPCSPMDHQHSPLRWKPAGVRVSMLQPASPISPCTGICRQENAHCILEISEREVFTAIQDLLRDARP
jgi:ADP-heptose:LPS heptosyltransferase